jgi:hypothetical protein
MQDSLARLTLVLAAKQARVIIEGVKQTRGGGGEGGGEGDRVGRER